MTNFTPFGFADAMDRFRDHARGAVVVGLRRNAPVVKQVYVNMATGRGVLHGIFGMEGIQSVARLVSVRVQAKGSSVNMAMSLRGFAALQETGGHTKPPRKGAIYPKGDHKALRFRTNGRFFASAKHRGARVPAFPMGERALAQVAPKIASDIDASLKLGLARLGIS